MKQRKVKQFLKPGPGQTPKDFLTTGEVAKKLGFTDATVRQYVKRGLLTPDPERSLPGRHVFARAAIEAFTPARRGYPKGKPRKKQTRQKVTHDAE